MSKIVHGSDELLKPEIVFNTIKYKLVHNSDVGMIVIFFFFSFKPIGHSIEPKRTDSGIIVISMKSPTRWKINTVSPSETDEANNNYRAMTIIFYRHFWPKSYGPTERDLRFCDFIKIIGRL